MQIMMLGPKSVGKTTALASMWREFNKAALSAGLRLTPLNFGMTQILEEKINELETLFGSNEASIRSTQGDFQDKIVEFQLERSRVLNLKSKIDISFYDYPGGYTLPQDPNHDMVTRNMNKSLAYMVVIDSSALMEQNGIHNALINRPVIINELLRHSLNDMSNNIERRLILLAPVKCETYIKDRHKQIELLDTVQRVYADIIEAASGNDNKFAVAITPLQTMGNVVFDRIEYSSKNAPQFFFKKTSNTALYQPINVDQPLYYLLSFVLTYFQEIENPSRWGRFNRLRGWLSTFLDQDVKRSTESLAARMKITDEYRIISGHKLFSQK